MTCLPKQQKRLACQIQEKKCHLAKNALPLDLVSCKKAVRQLKR